MYIVIAILIFGVLIAVHELGHFLAARACNVRVNEFSIGMGPAILKKQGKETLFSWRVFPFGGFCALEGEDDDTGDPRAFITQPAWKRVIILAAGAIFNFILGFIIVAIIFSQSSGFGGNTVASLEEGFPYGGEQGLMAGDTVLAIDGERVYYSGDFGTFMSRSQDGVVSMLVRRGGEKVLLENYTLRPHKYIENGEPVTRYGINFNGIEPTFIEKLKYSAYSSYNFVRLIRISLGDLFRGAVGIRDLSGPVGIVTVINDVGRASESAAVGLSNVAYLGAFIAINLAVMNLLPIPALDGGRIVMIFITWVIEKFTRRKLDSKYERYIHATGLVLLMGLMLFVMVNDIIKIFM
jgi:regulator of sigma E protease